MKVVSLLLVSALALVPREAPACGNAVYRQVKRPQQLLVRAEQALGRGDARAALQILEQRAGAREKWSTPSPELADTPERQLERLHPRGGLVITDAAAAQRWDFLLAVAHLRQGDRPAERVVRAFEQLAAAQGKAARPPLLARLAEAQARIPAVRPAARATLEQLARRDLVPDAEAWAALADLRGEVGDAAGQKAALERCRKLARPGSTVCGEGPAGHS